MAVVPSPLVLDGLIYTVKNGGVLTVLKADTGEVVKMGRVGAVPASYSASPVTAEGRIYLANEDGAVAVLRAGKDWEVVAMQRDRRAALRDAGAVAGPDRHQRRQVAVLFRIALRSGGTEVPPSFCHRQLFRFVRAVGAAVHGSSGHGCRG